MPGIKKEKPGPGQESAWDYPRPPRLEDVSSHIEVFFNGVRIADTHKAKRILETSHPPVYYIPEEDIQMQYLVPAEGGSFCEWKGWAGYYSVKVEGDTAESAAWYYPDPDPAYEGIKGHLAFYPGKMEACYVDGEKVKPQPGGFYGGWIISSVVGPFKGEAGTIHW